MNDLYTRDEWIKMNNLYNSFLSVEILWHCRPCIPEKEIIGTADNGDIIYFEENERSLNQRHLKMIDKADGWNLLFADKDGRNPQRVTRDYINTVNIDYFEGYSKKTLLDYIRKNPRIYNKLDGGENKKIKWSMYTTPEEKILIKEFVKRLREGEE